jgi:dihydrofolate reductase
MGRITTFTFVTLDGVMQAPARPDEDTRGGFGHGGWGAPYGDEVIGAVAAEGMARDGAMLFGRRTYEDFFDVWPNAPQPNPFTEVLNRRRKYVASRTLSEPLPWENSVLLDGDAWDAVAALKRDSEQDIVVLGSGTLVRALMARGLIDEYVVLIHPLVLGAGRRLFGDGGPSARLRLVDSKTSTTGVIIATYLPVEGAADRPEGAE